MRRGFTAVWVLPLLVAAVASAQNASSGGGSPANGGFTQQASYTGQRPGPQYVLIKFDDGYVWLVKDTVTGMDRRGTFNGKPMHVAHGAYANYSHVLSTTLVREEPVRGATRAASVPTDRDFRQQPSFSGQRPSPEYVPVRFDDGYVWLVKDAVTAIDKRGSYQGKPMHVAHGARADYYHVLNTTLVRQVGK